MRTRVLAVFLLWSAAASAQAPAAGASNELVVTLYNQLESLQNEVLTLRGLVEEQGYQLQRLQSESRDRYIDVDRRLSEVTLSGSAVPPAGGITSPGAADAALTPFVLNQDVGSNTTEPLAVPPLETGPGQSTGTVAAVTPAAQMPVLDEQEQYRSALNLLLEENRYDDAIVQFQAYIDHYPSGRLLTNALYWQGEALILVARYDAAIAAFSRLLQDYPQDAKAPGAMLKLGVAYDKKGARQQAEAQWRELPTRYPEASTEIKAAQDNLRR